MPKTAGKKAEIAASASERKAPEGDIRMDPATTRAAARQVRVRADSVFILFMFDPGPSAVCPRATAVPSWGQNFSGSFPASWARRRLCPRPQMLMTLSANCMAVTISSILVVSPTCFLSRRLKWVRQVPQTSILIPPFS